MDYLYEYLLYKQYILVFQNKVLQLIIFPSNLVLKTHSLLQFQLLFYGQRINSVYNVRNKFFLSCITPKADDLAPGVSFEKHSFDCFHVVEDNSWLYLKYFDFGEASSATDITTDNYPLHFDGSQNWPPTPYYGYSDQYDITGINTPSAPNGYNYLPQGLQSNSPLDGSNQFILPNIPISAVAGQQSSFIPPIDDQSTDTLNESFLPSIPFYNISVIEINRRLSTKGLL